jgi:hypothetical protein
VARLGQLVALECPVIDFDELRDLADEARAYIQMSDDKAFALRAIVISHDVVLGIYPSAEGMGLHVIKGDELLRQIANSNEVGEYSRAAIAVQDREQAETLQALVA